MPSDSSTPQAAATVSCTKPLRVLVVEDEKSAAHALATFFEMEGAQTAVAHDGLEAVRSAESFRPHLICMDLHMPRMDGFEAARLIREMLEDVVIVALCGLDDDASRRRTAQEGFHDHLVKPLAPETLRQLLEQFARR